MAECHFSYVEGLRAAKAWNMASSSIYEDLPWQSEHLPEMIGYFVNKRNRTHLPTKFNAMQIILANRIILAQHPIMGSDLDVMSGDFLPL